MGSMERIPLQEQGHLTVCRLGDFNGDLTREPVIFDDLGYRFCSPWCA